MVTEALALQVSREEQAAQKRAEEQQKQRAFKEEWQVGKGAKAPTREGF